MGDFELIQFSNPEELARTAASNWLTDLRNASTTSAYCVALPGGRIARQFFCSVADQAKESAGLFNSVHFFWGDERCVPPTDPESNFGLAKECLLEPLKVPEPRIHRIKGEEPPDLASAQAEQELRRYASRRGNGQPVLDLVFLGVGEEGHTASLFPGEPEEVIESKAVFRPVPASKPPPRRITIGYGTIAAASNVWVLASGPGKQRALAQSLTQAAQTGPVRVAYPVR